MNTIPTTNVSSAAIPLRCPDPPAPRHLRRAQDEARYRRDHHRHDGARKHGGAQLWQGCATCMPHTFWSRPPLSRPASGRREMRPHGFLHEGCKLARKSKATDGRVNENPTILGCASAPKAASTRSRRSSVCEQRERFSYQKTCRGLGSSFVLRLRLRTCSGPLRLGVLDDLRPTWPA
jgi:hypothetical protein